MVAEDRNVALGNDGAVGVERDVVADLQRDVAGLGEHQAVEHVAQRVGVVARQPCAALGEAGTATGQQFEVFVLVGRRFAHRQANVAGVGVSQHETQRGVGFGQVDASAGLEADVARGADAGIDVQVSAHRADAGAGAIGVEVDGDADHVGGEVGVASGAIAGALQDRAAHRAQRHVSPGLHQVDTQVAQQVVEEDAAGRCSGNVVDRQHALGIVAIDVDLEEIGGQADAALRAGRAGRAGIHRDVVTGHVDARRAVGVEDALR